MCPTPDSKRHFPGQCVFKPQSLNKTYLRLVPGDREDAYAYTQIFSFFSVYFPVTVDIQYYASFDVQHGN